MKKIDLPESDAFIQLQKFNQQWQLLTDATRHINSVLELTEVMRKLVASAMELTEAEEGTAGLLIDGKMVFTEYNQHGNIFPIDYSFEEGYGVPGWVMATGKPYISNKAETDEHVIPQIQKTLGFYNLADTPILNNKGEVIGCFELHNKPTGFDEHDVMLLQNLAASTAVAIENSRMIEERNRFEKVLSETETLYRTTFYSIGDAVITTDDKGFVQRMNPVAERLTGWKEADAQGKMLEEVFRIINEETREIVESPAQKVLKLGVIVGLANHTLLLSKDGREMPIADSGAPIKDEDSKVAGVVLVFRDQTEERKSQKLLEESEAKYRELIESTDAIAWEYDIELDKWIYVAPQVTDKLGWLPEEWTDLNFWKQNIHPNDREWAANFCLTATAKGESHTLEYRFMRKDGNYLWLRDVIAVEANNSKPVKLRGIMLDISELKNTELLLREREYFLSESQRVGKIGSYDFDMANNSWKSSQVLDEIFGITKENPHTLESWNALIHPEHQKEMLDYFINSVVKSRKPFGKEYKIIRESDGAERWVMGHGELSYNESGEPIRMFGTIQNITQRKIHEKELSESEERFRKAVLLAPIPIMVHDEDGNVINISEGWTHFSGYSIDDISTLNEWLQKAYGKKAEELENYVNGLFKEENAIYGGESEITTKTGEKRIWDFHTTPLGKLNSGKKIMLSMAPDVTQRVHAKNEIVKQKKLFETMFNTISDGVVITNTQREIVLANHGMKTTFGYEPNEIIGKTTELLYSDNEKFKETGTNFFNKLSPSVDNLYIAYYKDKSNRIFPGETFGAKLFDNTNEWIGNIGIMRNVSEREKLFSDLKTAKEKAEESERLKSAFLANMSHEIRTPLNGILGFTSLLTEDENLSKETKQEFATIINKNADGLLKIISDILDISRLEAGKTIMEKKPFDVIKMLQTIYPVFNKRLADSGKQKIELKLMYPENPIILNTDENRLMQVVSNLLDNSLKFTPEGNITFGVSKVTKTQLELFVSDTGIGISKEKQHLVFDRFSQAEESISRNYGGSGLGLAIVKKLVELMGGEIKLESEPGEGSVFRICLPVKLDSYIHEEAPQPKKFDFSKQTESVLVVEDDPASQRLLSHVLKTHFQDLTLATTGSEALLIIKNKKPDIILMDIRLPDSNGLEVVRQIRKFDTNVYIIAQTAYAMADDERLAFEAGCNDFITKPI